MHADEDDLGRGGHPDSLTTGTRISRGSRGSSGVMPGLSFAHCCGGVA